NGELVLGIGLSAAAGMIALAPAIVETLIGADFREGALTVFPWIVLAAAISGIKAYHFDIAFYLAKNSRLLVITVAVAAAANVVLNMFLIPEFGIRGAAWSS